MKDNQYITILAPMRTRLGLKGLEVNVYALIYGFSQDGRSEFNGSLSYISNWLGVCKNTTIKLLATLIERNLIIKTVRFENGVRLCSYRANLNKWGGGANPALPIANIELGVVQILDGGSANSAPNNNIDIIEDNKEDTNVSKKEIHQSSNFETEISTEDNTGDSDLNPKKEILKKKKGSGGSVANETNESFEIFWSMYGKKVGSKIKLKKKWERLSKATREKIFIHVPKYVASTPDVQYRKNPETYLNNQAWEDEIINSNKNQNGKDKRNNEQSGIDEDFYRNIAEGIARAEFEKEQRR